MAVNISSLITSDPKIHQGTPHIVSTDMTVHRLAIWYKLGRSPEEIAHQYPHLNLAQVYAALAHYHANREMIDAEIAVEEREYLAMNVTKTEISLPDPIFEEAEALSTQLGLSRSELYTKALKAYLHQRKRYEISNKLNQVYSQESSQLDLALAKMQFMSLPCEEW